MYLVGHVIFKPSFLYYFGNDEILFFYFVFFNMKFNFAFFVSFVGKLTCSVDCKIMLKMMIGLIMLDSWVLLVWLVMIMVHALTLCNILSKLKCILCYTVIWILFILNYFSISSSSWVENSFFFGFIFDISESTTQFLI